MFMRFFYINLESEKNYTVKYGCSGLLVVCSINFQTFLSCSNDKKFGSYMK